MSDTPKTDNLCLDLDDGFARQSDLIAFARDLERENAALRQALEDMPTCRCGLSTDEQCALSVQNAALREVLNLTVDRLMFYMECIPMAHKDYIKTLEGKISYEIVNKSLILLKKEAQP